MKAVSRRPYGSGSVVERSPGVWRLTIPVAPDPWTGARRQITRTFRGTRRQAEARLAELRAANADRHADTDATIAQLHSEWWPTKTALAPVTRRVWRAQIARHILPTIGTRRLRELRPPMIEAWHRRLIETGVPVSVVRNCHTILSSMLTYAVRCGWLATNPAKGAEKPAYHIDKRDTPDGGEVRALLAATAGTLEAAWIRLALVTGGRKGELIGLRWGDVDFAGQVITISRQVIRVQGRYVETPVKGRLRDRAPRVRRMSVDDGVTIPTLLALLGEQERNARGFGSVFDRGGYILSGSLDGTVPIHPERMTRMWTALKARAGVDPGLHLHDLRHFVASVVANEISAAAAADRLGHSNTQMTLNTYVRAGVEESRRGARAIAAHLDG